MQEDVTRLRSTLDTMDEVVSKTSNALTLEQALNASETLQKKDVLGRMESLAGQVWRTVR